MNSLSLPAPAKINLFLHVTGRRPDGYHLLQTVFQFLDYCDDLTFTLRTDGKLRLISDCADVPSENNLILRAATLLQQMTKSQYGADISITKRIPIGGGLGGGSSNAATTLIGLNALWQTHLSQTQLAELGLQLGADVPIFIYGKAAWAEGIGEQLQAIDPPENWVVMVVPPCQVSTSEIFSAPELTRNTQPITIPQFFAQGGRNDLEPVARQRYPEVDAAWHWLSQFATARMTGSGSCVFAQFADQKTAAKVLQQLPPSFQGWIAKTLNVSPLQQKVIGV